MTSDDTVQVTMAPWQFVAIVLVIGFAIGAIVSCIVYKFA